MISLLALPLLLRAPDELLAALLFWLLALLLWLLLAQLLGLVRCLLAALLPSRKEPTGLGITWPLFGQVVHPLAELLGVTSVLRTLVPAAALLAGEPGLLADRLLLSGGLTLLTLGLVRLRLLHLLALGLRLGLLLGLLHLLSLWLLALLLGLLLPELRLLWLRLLRPRLLHLPTLRLLHLLVLWLLSLGLGLLDLLALRWLHLLCLGLLVPLLLALLSAGELAGLSACGQLLLVFGRHARRSRGALLLAALLCLSLLSLLTELVLVVLIAHRLSPVTACRFQRTVRTAGSIRRARRPNTRRVLAVPGSIRRSHWSQLARSLKQCRRFSLSRNAVPAANTALKRRSSRKGISTLGDGQGPDCHVRSLPAGTRPDATGYSPAV